MQDLLSGIHYSLRQEVAGYKALQGEALDALKKYTTVLAKVSTVTRDCSSIPTNAFSLH